MGGAEAGVTYRWRGILAGWALGVPALISAQAIPTATSQPVAVGERVTLMSNVLHEKRYFDIFVPRAAEFERPLYPVIYFLDGEVSFLAAVSAVTSLAMVGLMPQAIVVAVGNTDRNRDFTPKPDSPKNVSREFATYGGADAFLDYLEQEVIPYVETHHPAAPLRVLVGHSLGGLLTVHALTSRPTLFQGYITLEPSLWWDNRGAAARLIAALRRRSASPVGLVTVERENNYGFRPEWKQVQQALGRPNFARLIETKGESHISMTYQGRYDALKALFADSSWRGAARTRQ